MKTRDILRLVQDEGWYQVAQRGSHRRFKHPVKPGKVTIAGHPSEEMDEGTRKSIFHAASYRKDIFPSSATTQSRTTGRYRLWYHICDIESDIRLRRPKNMSNHPASRQTKEISNAKHGKDQTVDPRNCGSKAECNPR
jgi:predicted RNA binding protein YcfA (HicA-like mRNA interferase family)